MKHAPTVVFFLVCVSVCGWLFYQVCVSRVMITANLPDQSDVRQYLIDCEQFNPSRQCIVVAMPVPDFSDRGSE